MSKYSNDPWVRPSGNGFDVTRDGEEFHVRHTDVFGWTVSHGPNLDFVPVEGGGFAIGFSEADNAIDALFEGSR